MQEWAWKRAHFQPSAVIGRSPDLEMITEFVERLQLTISICWLGDRVNRMGDFVRISPLRLWGIRLTRIGAFGLRTLRTNLELNLLFVPGQFFVLESVGGLSETRLRFLSFF